MASEFSSRSFLSADLIWGVKQSDPLGVVHYRRKSIILHTKNAPSRPNSRYLSENPSTYLR